MDNETENENEKIKLVVKISEEETYTLAIPREITIQELAVITQKFSQLLKQFKGDIELMTKPTGFSGSKTFSNARNPRGIPREAWIEIIKATKEGNMKKVEELKEKYKIARWDTKTMHSTKSRYDITKEELNAKPKENGNGILKSKLKGGK